MQTDELEYQINARLAGDHFEVAITDEGDYWHVKITEGGASGGILLPKAMEQASRLDELLDVQVVRLLYAWVQTRYHRPITGDWFRL